MANQLGMIHPKMLTALGGFYPITCTIQVATITQDAAGQEVKAWANLANHVDLPCAFGVSGGSGRESRTSSQAYVTDQRRLILPGAYTSITEAMSAVVEGVRYNILSVFFDSHVKQTYLDVESVS